MKNLGRKSINLSLDLVAIATGALSIYNFFKKKTSNVKKDNIPDGTRVVRELQGHAPCDQTSREPIRLDFRDPGYRRGSCGCGQVGCPESPDNNPAGK